MSLQCFMPTCDRKRDRKWAICTTCFQVLPTDLRMAISRAFSPGITNDDPTPGLRYAVNNAQAWIVARLGVEGGAQRSSYTPEKWERLKETVRTRDAARAQRKLDIENEARVAAGKAPRPAHLKLVP